MSDQKILFLTTNLTEQERLSALTLVIDKYNETKDILNDDKNTLKRSKILSIWSDLVLSRSSDPQIHVLGELNDENTEITRETKDNLVDDFSNLDANYNSEETEFIDSIEIVSEIVAEKNLYKIQLIKNAQFQDQILYPGTILTTNFEYANELIGSGIAIIVEDNEEKEKLITSEIVEDSKQQDNEIILKKSIDLVSNFVAVDVNNSVDKNLDGQVIKDIDSDQQNILIDHSQNDFKIENANLSISKINDNIESAKINIAENNLIEEKSLIAIHNMQSDSPINIDIDTIKGENSYVQDSILVRLRLLKTGILHDMVLPEGTVVSTNLADAEELIASGTAERLLIQRENGDVDDY